jgi:putative DNA primase/helicase
MINGTTHHEYFDNQVITNLKQSNSLLSLSALSAEVGRLIDEPSAVPHDEVLRNLLEQVQPVDFRALANLDDEKDKLRTQHYVVLVIQEMLALAQRNNWGLCRRQGFLYSYNRAYWQQLDESTLRAFLKEIAERLGVPPMNARFYGFGEQLYKQFLDTATLPAPSPKSRLTVLINLQNGTYEIGEKKQSLRPFVAADFLTHQLPFAYSTKAAAPRWQAFLDRVVPDASSQQVLAEYLGYLFVAPSRLKLEKVLLLHGGGANGKSVFFEVVTALLGSENVSNYSLNDLTTEPAYPRAYLATKLVNYASELGRGLEANTFKQLVSGEPIAARLPYGQPFVLTDYAKFIFNANELPSQVEHTHAFFRRFLIVPFSVTIPDAEQDKTLAAKIISEELAGVFMWVLNGLGRLLAQQGFTNCEAAHKQLEMYKLQSDTVRLFLEEREYVASPDLCKPTNDVYQDYRQFCVDYGHRCPVARGKFVTRLREAAGIAESRRNSGKVLFLARAA